MAFDHRAYMAEKGNKPASKIKLKDGSTFRVPGYKPEYTVENLSALAKVVGVEKYTNKKVAVGEAEVVGTNAILPGEAAEVFVLGCLTGKAPEVKQEAQKEEQKQEATPNGQHNRLPAVAGKK